MVCALEPEECSTLFNNGRGTHRIGGIGDKMVTLIHNVLTTDYIGLIHDDDCVAGLELLERRRGLVERILGTAPGSLGSLAGLFGISGICNILGAMRLARHLDLGAEENVVTIATDGMDRYPSVLANLEKRRGPLDEARLAGWFEEIFRGGDSSGFLDVRGAAEKNRLFTYKEQVWTNFGYSRQYLESMKSQSFWDAEFEKIREVDEAVATNRVSQF
jgi:hypothetical protein